MENGEINPLLHSVAWEQHLAKIFDFKIRRDNKKKIRMIRYTITAYLRLHLKNRRKKELLLEKVNEAIDKLHFTRYQYYNKQCSNSYKKHMFQRIFEIEY